MDEVDLKEFKRSYHRCGKYNLYVQIPHLVKLADRYREKYKDTKNWTDCLKVRDYAAYSKNLSMVFTNTNTNTNYSQNLI